MLTRPGHVLLMRVGPGTASRTGRCGGAGVQTQGPAHLSTRLPPGSLLRGAAHCLSQAAASRTPRSLKRISWPWRLSIKQTHQLFFLLGSPDSYKCRESSGCGPVISFPCRNRPSEDTCVLLQQTGWRCSSVCYLMPVT